MTGKQIIDDSPLLINLVDDGISIYDAEASQYFAKDDRSSMVGPPTLEDLAIKSVLTVSQEEEPTAAELEEFKDFDAFIDDIDVNKAGATELDDGEKSDSSASEKPEYFEKKEENS